MELKKQKNEGAEAGKFRPIDKEAGEVVGLWKKSFIFVTRTEMKTWKIVLVLAFVAGLATAIVAVVSFDREQKSRASLVPARIFFTPASLSLEEGEQFNVDLNLDAAGGNVVVSRADISYNTSNLQLLSSSTSGSAFSSENACVYNSKPCEIINNDPTSGKLSITLAKPSPGISSSSGKIATLTFKALKPINSSTSDLKINFSSQGSYSDSDVILDDGNGTDTLSGVGLLSLSVIAPDTTAPVISGGSPTGELSFSTTQTDLSVQANEKSICKYSKTAGTEYSSMVDSLSSSDSLKHAASLSGLTAGTTYNYYVRCQDLIGNKTTSDYKVSFSIATKTTTKGKSSTSPGKTKK
ncbi:MAG TPA: hypothetical protein DCX32_00160 [Candidatus Moranbacteria bacterium]|nr:MAG: hypothetical protein UW87_C0005G0045 [Candidatus Moranbacteria bacterium GW2011_GWC2_45_10]KKT95259.1 MAG: hypothetical protein UW95_C0002G0002 [Parcubacteria group bacterium GW2011_GWC1_45_14]HAV10950.1 hypothetical protein [Candidatus Moranbacteria bacterium]